jgi:hypothetical protein
MQLSRLVDRADLPGTGRVPALGMFHFQDSRLLHLLFCLQVTNNQVTEPLHFRLQKEA